jgi:hypothetical protein
MENYAGMGVLSERRRDHKWARSKKRLCDVISNYEAE